MSLQYKNEAALQRACVKFATGAGWLVYKFDSSTTVGVPDLILMRDGECIFIEMKHPNGLGVLSKKQCAEIIKIRRAGITVHVIHDYEVFKRVTT